MDLGHREWFSLPEDGAGWDLGNSQFLWEPVPVFYTHIIKKNISPFTQYEPNLLWCQTLPLPVSQQLLLDPGKAGQSPEILGMRMIFFSLQPQILIRLHFLG